MRLGKSELGFTLIEIMLVLVIGSIMAGMAAYSVGKSKPRYDLARARDILSMTLQEARSRSIRTGRPHRVCIWKDIAGAPNPTLVPDVNRAVIVACRFDFGALGCTLPACAPSGAFNAANYSAADQTKPWAQPEDVGTAGGLGNRNDPNKEVDLEPQDLNIGTATRESNSVDTGIEKIVLEAFLDANGADMVAPQPRWVEIGFGLLGQVEPTVSYVDPLGSGTPKGFRVQVELTGTDTSFMYKTSKAVRWVDGGMMTRHDCTAPPLVTCD